MKHILLLGAGFMQKPAILAAKELGCHVTAVDGNPNACSAPLADRFEPVDLKNIPDLLYLARQMKDTHGIDAVFTAGTDFSASVARIAEELSLPGHSYEAALNASDKVRMRSCFAASSVPSPHYAQLDRTMLYLDLVQLLSAAGFLKNTSTSRRPNSADRVFPLVVKPVDNMGARGCRMVRSIDELIPALSSAVDYSRSGRAILEEYMDGPEFSIDSLVYNGTVTVTGFADRHIYYPPYFIEMGHTMPTEFSKKDIHQMLDVFISGVHSLGLTCGAAKGDIKLTKKGPMIGEIAARLSGGYMSGWTYPYASGINLTRQALLLALGMKPEIPLSGSIPPCTAYSAERAWISIPGVVSSVAGYEDAQKVQCIEDIFPRSAVGDAVRFPLNNVEKCGNVISRASSREEAVSSAHKAVRSITVVLEKNNKSTDEFLAQPLNSEFPPSAYPLSAKRLIRLASYCSEADQRGTCVITREKPCIEQMPDFLLEKADKLSDWNGKCMDYALRQFEQLAPPSFAAPASEFWKTFIRGGLQGILYIAEKYRISE